MHFTILAVCAALFALRVAGQAVVVAAAPRWLPPMEHWYSGLLPYRFLLPAQLALLALMTAVAADLCRGEGFFASGKWSNAALALTVAAGVYFFSMLARYFVTMALRPELRWFKRTIPIWLHLALATALWAFADYHRA